MKVRECSLNDLYADINRLDKLNISLQELNIIPCEYQDDNDLETVRLQGMRDSILYLLRGFYDEVHHYLEMKKIDEKEKAND